jgi:hypothetical protein
MSDKILFSYERMEPRKYPEPRDIRMQLNKQICFKYKNKPLSDIPLSTEIILKTIKPKDPTKAEILLLKYKVCIEDWEETREMKDVIFNPKNFRWVKNPPPEYGEVDHGGGDPCGGGHGGY